MAAHQRNLKFKIQLSKVVISKCDIPSKTGSNRQVAMMVSRQTISFAQLQNCIQGNDLIRLHIT